MLIPASRCSHGAEDEGTPPSPYCGCYLWASSQRSQAGPCTGSVTRGQPLTKTNSKPVSRAMSTASNGRLSVGSCAPSHGTGHPHHYGGDGHGKMEGRTKDEGIREGMGKGMGKAKGPMDHAEGSWNLSTHATQLRQDCAVVLQQKVDEGTIPRSCWSACQAWLSRAWRMCVLASRTSLQRGSERHRDRESLRPPYEA